ncbi:MAG: hypothetical protein GY784_18885 [Gammaproteobacteria bacterium]|nr:hypothetical protein [Gammaproteobacteria bacterium]
MAEKLFNRRSDYMHDAIQISIQSATLLQIAVVSAVVSVVVVGEAMP